MKNFKIKKYFRLIVLVFIFLIILILRNNLSSFFVNLFYPEKIIGNNQNSLLDEENVLVKGGVKTPGALQLINKLFNDENVVLSKEKVINITNEYRVGNELKPLKENSKLTASAEKKLKDIFDNQYFEHVSEDGVGIENLAEDVGYKYIIIGENLALGNFKSDENLVDSWMNSKGHRENILNKNYTEIGVAIGKGVFKKNNVWVAVQHFGTPRSACPVVEEYLKDKIEINQKHINDIKEELSSRLFEIKRGYVPNKGPKDIKKAEEYNNLVIYYNNLAEVIEKDTETYNKQINDFNECILKYQD